MGILGIAAIGGTVAAFFLINKKNNKPNQKIDNQGVKPEDTQNLKPNERDKETIDEDIDDNGEEIIKDIDKPSKKRKIIETPWKEVFPEIKSEDYYDYLNFKDGQGWIDENMITVIIKDILNRMTVTDGKIKYAYKQIDNQNVIISLYWQNQTRKSFVSYKISINKL
ncbi:MHO_1590 family protein [[Mycoplasma] phocidae]|uniref:MHO_1590 family protein n=1 Tax=[Mycoplasma] phocae TaxID=142651 RepID=UPI002410C800|nr:hypothetical protein [[Mycoplasma] phocae]